MKRRASVWRELVTRPRTIPYGWRVVLGTETAAVVAFINAEQLNK
jgi:hypothetical protein